MLKIHITNLTEGWHQYQFQETLAQIGLNEDSRFTGMIEVELGVERSGERFHTQIKVKTTGNFICDCCLDPFERLLNQEIESYYIQGAGPEKLSSEGEIKYLAVNADDLDIADDVRDALLLSVSMKILCQEECKGLCPNCGVNWNHTRCDCSREKIDPRWEVLKKIRFDHS
jgi:uncharacterized protein